MKRKIPKFLENLDLPESYYSTSYPIKGMDGECDMRGMIDYADKVGKDIVDLTYEEALPYYPYLATLPRKGVSKNR